MKLLLPRLRNALSCLALGACAFGAHAQTVLFQDDFETDSSANWIVLGESPNTPESPDINVQFHYNYATNTFEFNGQQRTIPQAPSGTGSHGVRIDVNKTPISPVPADNLAAANIFPKDQSFSGNYALKFDMWINYNGGRDGGAGSTEFALFGINHTGTQTSWQVGGTGGDGIWFAVTGEGGAARDYRSYENDGTAVIERQGLDGGLLATLAESADPFFTTRFPLAEHETPGAPSKRWVPVEVYQLNGNLVWKINGYVIAERPNSAPFTEGNIMLGAMDVFSSVADPGKDNYFLFDNVRVVSLPETPLPTVTIAVADESATEPSTDTASFTISRTGDDVSSALTVRYRVEGTAEAGIDYETTSGTVTIPAGSSEASVVITPKDDTRGEPSETVILTLLGAEIYELRNDITAQVNILDDGDVAAINLTVADAHAYEKNNGDTGSFLVSRIGDTSQTLTVNIQITGTAVNGTDYESLPATVVLDAGVESATIVVNPRDNAALDENRTVIATLQPGTGYTMGANTTGTVTIRNDDIPPAPVIFSENFQTVESGDTWNINSHSEGNNSAEFGFDYSSVGIPAAPNTTDGSTRGLKLQANNGPAGLFTGISVSPQELNLTNDYRLRFDMWNNFVGPLTAGGTGSTMMFSAGLATNSTVAQFPGTSIQGIMFAASGDGGTGTDYRAYTATGAPINATNGVYAAGNTAAAQNNTAPYYNVFGGRTAPQAQIDLFPSQTEATSPGALGMAWHEVVITKTGTVVTWDVDNVRIATVDVGEKPIEGTIFVGFFDINTGQSENHDVSFGLVDNLRVEQLTTTSTPPEIEITNTTVAGGQVTIRFTATSGAATNFSLVSSTLVEGPYTPVNAPVTQVSPGVFEATTSAAEPHRFFQVRYNP